eukprot:COSAG01_NODE_53479_length_339_cov_0.437500_1_plen_75_part_00
MQAAIKLGKGEQLLEAQDVATSIVVLEEGCKLAHLDGELTSRLQAALNLAESEACRMKRAFFFQAEDGIRDNER